jgi:hypothetical protein
MQHVALKLAAPLAAAAVTLLVTASLRAEPLYPEVVNTSHATPQVAAFFKSTSRCRRRIISRKRT